MDMKTNHILHLGLSDNIFGGMERVACSFPRASNQFTNNYAYFIKEPSEITATNYSDAGLIVLVDNNNDLVSYLKHSSICFSSIIIHSSGFINPYSSKKLFEFCDNVIIWGHTSLLPDQHTGPRMILKKILFKFGYYILPYKCISVSSKAARFMFPPGKRDVIANTIEPSLFSFSDDGRKAIRQKLDIQNDAIVLGCASRLVKWKHIDYVIKMFYELQKLCSCKLLIIGSGPEKDNLLKLATEYKIADKVYFEGQVQNVLNYYSSMDIYVFPKTKDSFNMTLLEAQANGLPVVTSKFMPKEVFVTNHIYGLYYNSPKKWALYIFGIVKRISMFDRHDSVCLASTNNQLSNFLNSL